MRSALLLAVLVAGCVGLPDVRGKVVTTCPATCLGAFTGEVETNCATWESNVSLAQRIADEAGIIPAADFCGLDNPVHVANVDRFEHSLSKTEFGYITLSKRGIHLLHELLHLWDEAHLVYNPNHVKWDVNGYQAADNKFRRASIKYAP